MEKYLDRVVDYKTENTISEEAVMALLPEHLQNKLTCEINGRLLSKFKALKEFPVTFQSNLIFIFQRARFSMDEFVYNKNDEATYMAVIVHG